MGRSRRPTTRWSGPGILRQKQEELAIPEHESKPRPLSSQPLGGLRYYWKMTTKSIKEGIDDIG